MYRRRRVIVAAGKTLVGLLAFGGLQHILVPLNPAHAQTLDEAVRSQLFAECAVLLDGQDPSAALTGTLQQICIPTPSHTSIPCPGRPPENCVIANDPISPNSARGGAAATPAKLPGIIERRLREARVKNSGSATIGAASAEAVATFPSGLSAFVSGQFMSLDKAVTASEDGYYSDLRRITAGVEFHFTYEFNAGVALDSYQHDGNLVGDGKFEDELAGFIAYGMLAPTDEFYVQFLAGYARIDSQRERFATWGELHDEFEGVVITGGTITSKSNSDQFRVGGLGAYEFLISNVTVGLRIGLDWSLVKFSGLEEKGARTQGVFDSSVPAEGSTGLELRFDENEQTSLQTTTGLHAQTAFQINRVGILVPHVSVDWKHEFKQDQRDIKVSFVEDLRGETFSYKSEKPDRDWIEFGAGLALNLQRGLRLFSNYRTLIGHSLFTSNTVTLGMRTTFQ